MPGTDGSRWRNIGPYLDRALEMSERERTAWLAELRQLEPEIADELRDWLSEHRVVTETAFLAGHANLGLETSLAGSTIGNYRLVAPIGEGGMGTVWRAQRSDGRFERTAAVKLLHAALIGRPAGERFKREGEFLARLTHPHIARLSDAGVSAAGQPYLVLEYIEGEPIDRYCDERCLDLPARIRLFLDVLAAVAHAHTHLIVHRDLKPSNVLVTSDGTVKLLDFGIAKLLEHDTRSGEATRLTRTSGSALTPVYAAPEQLSGAAVTTATDVHALGVVLYGLLTAQHPIGAVPRSPAVLIKAIIDSDRVRMSDAVVDARAVAHDTLVQEARHRATTPDKLRRLLRGDLDTIVARALKPLPSERYGSVTQLADDLQRYLALEPIRARPDTAGYRAMKFVRRHASALAAATAVVALVAGLLAFDTIRLTAERDRARVQAAKAEKVSGLMMNLMTGADPYRDPDRQEVTVRQVLDRSAALIERELADDPDVQSEMLTMLGRTYERLGTYDKAQPLLERALALAERGDSAHARVGQALNNLGVLLRMKGDYPASVSMLERSLAVRRRALGNAHIDVAVTLVELGRSYRRQALPDRAEPLYREALAIRRRAFGDEHRETATSKGDLGLLLMERGALTEAERLLRESLDTSRRVLGDGHPNTAGALDNLGLLLTEKNENAAAEMIFRESLDHQRQVFGPRHPSLASTLGRLASSLRAQARYDEAITVLDEALNLARATMDPGHPTLAGYLCELGRVHAARGEAAAAERLFRQALSARVRAFGENDWRVAATKSLLGDSLTGLKRYAEAEPLLIDARRVLKDVPGEQGREARATAQRLVALYTASGQNGEAAQYVRPKT